MQVRGGDRRKKRSKDKKGCEKGGCNIHWETKNLRSDPLRVFLSKAFYSFKKLFGMESVYRQGGRILFSPFVFPPTQNVARVIIQTHSLWELAIKKKKGASFLPERTLGKLRTAIRIAPKTNQTKSNHTKPNLL